MKIIRRKVHESHDNLLFFCFACNHNHAITDEWEFNGDYDKPTFKHSVGVNMDKANPASFKCHIQITNGKIHYHGDCDHDLVGKVFDMKDI